MWAKAPGLWSITSSHVCSSNCCVWASLNPALPPLSPDFIYTLIPASFLHWLSSVFHLSLFLPVARGCPFTDMMTDWKRDRCKKKKEATIMTLESMFFDRVHGLFYQVRQKAGASSWSCPVIPLWEAFSTQRGPVIQSDIHTSMFLSSLYCTTSLSRLEWRGQSGLLCL